MTQQELTNQAYDIASRYVEMFADPIIVVPMIGAWCVGYLFSQSKYVTTQKLQSEKNLRVYSLNAAVAMTLFNVVTDPIEGTRAMTTILCGGLSIAIPYFWFEVYKKNKKNKKNKKK